MFNNADVKLMSNCIANYIELANTQKDALTVGSLDCTTLIEFYDRQITDCYILQSKVNGLLLETLNTKKNESIHSK